MNCAELLGTVEELEAMFEDELGADELMTEDDSTLLLAKILEDEAIELLGTVEELKSVLDIVDELANAELEDSMDEEF